MFPFLDLVVCMHRHLVAVLVDCCLDLVQMLARLVGALVRVRFDQRRIFKEIVKLDAFYDIRV